MGGNQVPVQQLGPWSSKVPSDNDDNRSQENQGLATVMQKRFELCNILEKANGGKGSVRSMKVNGLMEGFMSQMSDSEMLCTA